VSTTVYFIDSRVSNLNYILGQVATDTLWFVIPADQNGIEFVVQTLSAYESVETVHLVSHGGDGFLTLGSCTLDIESIDAYSVELAGIGSALSQDADLLLYGCSVAQTDAGEQFVAALAESTGADVAASDDLTGIGGDSELEYVSGAIETNSLDLSSVPALANYNGTSGDDAIVAGSTNDFISGSIGNDTIDGGDGEDVIFYEFLGTGSSGITADFSDATSSAQVPYSSDLFVGEFSESLDIGYTEAAWIDLFAGLASVSSPSNVMVGTGGWGWGEYDPITQQSEYSLLPKDGNPFAGTSGSSGILTFNFTSPVSAFGGYFAAIGQTINDTATGLVTLYDSNNVALTVRELNLGAPEDWVWNGWISGSADIAKIEIVSSYMLAFDALTLSQDPSFGHVFTEVTYDVDGDPKSLDDAYVDYVRNVEALHGSQAGDNITLDNTGSYVFGRQGDDTLVGGDGFDHFIGGADDDNIDGGASIDSASYFDDGYEQVAQVEGIVANLSTGDGLPPFWSILNESFGHEIGYEGGRNHEEKTLLSRTNHGCR